MNAVCSPWWPCCHCMGPTGFEFGFSCSFLLHKQLHQLKIGLWPRSRTSLCDQHLTNETHRRFLWLVSPMCSPVLIASCSFRSRQLRMRLCVFRVSECLRGFFPVMGDLSLFGAWRLMCLSNRRQATQTIHRGTSTTHPPPAMTSTRVVSPCHVIIMKTISVD